MWDIVVWQEGKSVEEMDYVPTCWRNDLGQYKWPTYCSRLLLESLINSCDPLLTIKHKFYKAMAKKTNIKSLEEAKKYCDRGLETSNIESNIDSNRETTEEDISSDEDRPIVNRKRFNSPEKLVADEQQGSSSGCSGSSSAIQETTRTALSNLSVHQSLREEAQQSTQPRSGISEQGTTRSKTDLTLLTPSQHIIYKKLCGIEFEVNQLKRQMTARIDTLEKKIFEFSRRPLQIGQDDVPIFLADLPAKDDEALVRLNEKIQTNEEDMKELVASLYLCGGSTVHKAIYAQMKKLLSKEVSLFYSGEGKKNKKSFKDLKIYDAVVRAVRQRFNTVTDVEIKRSVSAFLAGAKDRDGGRRCRLRDEVVTV